MLHLFRFGTFDPALLFIGSRDRDVRDIGIDGDLTFCLEIKGADGAAKSEGKASVALRYSDFGAVSVEAPAQDMSLSVLVAPTEAGYAVDCDLTAQGMYVGAKIELANGENMKLDAQLFFMNPEKPLLTASAVVIPGGEVTLDLSGEGKENIDLAQLMQDEDGTLKNNLLMDVMSNGLNGLMARAAEIMPEEVSTLITLLMGGGQEAVEAPAAE